MSAITYKTMWEGREFLTLIDVLDAAFYRANGMLAPGKDYPAECGEVHSHEERRARFRAWLGLLGPSDVAALVALTAWKQDEL